MIIDLEISKITVSKIFKTKIVCANKHITINNTKIY